MQSADKFAVLQLKGFAGQEQPSRLWRCWGDDAQEAGCRFRPIGKVECVRFTAVRMSGTVVGFLADAVSWF